MAKSKNIVTIVIITLTVILALLIVQTLVKGGAKPKAGAPLGAPSGGTVVMQGGGAPGAGGAPGGGAPPAPGGAGAGAPSGGVATGRGAGTQGGATATGGAPNASGVQGERGSAGAGAGATAGGAQGGASTGHGANSQGGAGASSGGGGAQGGGRQQTRTAVSVRTIPVTLGSVSNYVTISGDVLASRQVSIYPQAGGRIIELRVRIGDSVRQGEVVARIDPSKPGEVYSASPVTSPISGTVISAPYSSGDTVTTQSALYAIGDLSSIVIETALPERFSTAVRLGLSATASFEAMAGETFPLEVVEMSPVLDTATRTLRIRLAFKGKTDPRIRAGMFATVSLVTASHENVPLIPRSCLINTYGDWVVFTVDEKNIAHRKVVTLGLENEESVEITGGISQGDTVVSVGQNFLSEGESVRVVQ